jgi:hypothetical protein
MSKTDKTRPGWVREFYEGDVEHDHTGGECRVETLDDVRRSNRFRSPSPTCGWRVHRGYVNWLKLYGARMDAGFEHLIYHNPMRRSARDVLARARGEYNAGHRPGDDNIEDSWEPSILPANNAAWLFW